MLCCLIAVPQTITIVLLKITEHITTTGIIIMKMFAILRELPKYDIDTSEHMLLKNGSYILAGRRVATNLQLVKERNVCEAQ
jgi:hypothetical protein